MGKHIYLDDIHDVGHFNEIQTIEDKIDMQLLNIIDDKGNLLMDNPKITQSSKNRSGKSGNRRKKRK